MALKKIAGNIIYFFISKKNLKIWFDSFKFFFKTTIKIINNNFSLYNFLLLITIFLYSKILVIYKWSTFDKIIGLLITIYLVNKYQQLTKVICNYYCKFIDDSEKYMIINVLRIVPVFLIIILGIIGINSDVNPQKLLESSVFLKFIKMVKDYLV